MEPRLHMHHCLSSSDCCLPHFHSQVQPLLYCDIADGLRWEALLFSAICLGKYVRLAFKFWSGGDLGVRLDIRTTCCLTVISGQGQQCVTLQEPEVLAGAALEYQTQVCGVELGLML